MSNFNQSNNLAAQLCWGRYYQSDGPAKLDRVVLRKTNAHFREEVVITVPNEEVPTSHKTWAAVASYIHGLMNDGFVPSYEGGVEEGSLVCEAKPWNPETDEL